ncbi:unnamed protein product [Paramecium octaurelia]|uniref:VPS9 domain-containing protein n=1 Tax=Paramecium octaurelia TaxID=43137 RepID=A0A8S1VT16_PAROT|nr:unnamed protein product [Paramecium octaurelia]
MGNESSKNETQDSSELLLSQHTKTIESSQVENSNIFVYENKIKYCFLSCNCFGLIKTQIVEIQLSWINYTLRKLNRSQYKHQAWSDLIKQRLHNIDLNNFEDQQAIYLNNVRMIISNYETNPLIYKNKISNQFEDTEISKINIFEYYEEEVNTIFEDRKKSGIIEKKFFREVMGAINQQIKVTGHPCGLILQTFQNYIINYTGPQVWFRDSFKRDKYKDQLVKSTELCDEIIEFLKFFVNCIESYYMIDKFVQSTHLLNCFTSTNNIAFVINILFLDERIYLKILKSFSELYSFENYQYQLSLKILKQNTITDFDVNLQLQLNFQPQMSYEIQQDNLKGNPSIQYSDYEDFNQPYQSAINMLKQLEQVQSPANQLKIISKTFKQINFCISDYYEKHPELEALKSYGTDDIVPILTYIIVKCNIQNFGIILKIIEAFTPKQIMTGILGYYLVTTMGCYQRISQFEKSQQIRQTLQKAKSEIESVNLNQFQTKVLSSDQLKSDIIKAQVIYK